MSDSWWLFLHFHWNLEYLPEKDLQDVYQEFPKDGPCIPTSVNIIISKGLSHKNSPESEKPRYLSKSQQFQSGASVRGKKSLEIYQRFTPSVSVCV